MKEAYESHRKRQEINAQRWRRMDALQQGLSSTCKEPGTRLASHSKTPGGVTKGSCPNSASISLGTVAEATSAHEENLDEAANCLSEDLGLTTYFFLGVMGWGDGDSRVSRRRRRRRRTPGIIKN